LRRKNQLGVLAIVIILAGLILAVIAFSEVSQSTAILDQTIDVKLSSPLTSYTISSSYFLNGAHNGKISGTLHSSDCCVDFLIFTDSAWNSWMADGMHATNASNSPALAIDYNLIKSSNGTAVPFAFIPDPSTIYWLAFFNNNRSQWNSSSTYIMHVFADINISYTKAAATFLQYPAIALIVLGVAVIVWAARFPR